MKRALFYIFPLVSLAFFSFGLIKTVKLVKPKTDNENSIVVMELFTSQGCSSCPPADAVLGKYILQNNPNIIALSFHVDYWNYIGWKDPFSQHQFTERQQQYASRLNSSVYTPQLFINGAYSLVGSNDSEIEEIVKEESKKKALDKIDILSITASERGIKIKYKVENSNNNNLHINFALVKKEEITTIKRGENSGKTLTNYNIVINFKTISYSNNGSNEIIMEVPHQWKPNDYQLISYLQQGKSGKILDASKNEIKI